MRCIVVKIICMALFISISSCSSEDENGHKSFSSDIDERSFLTQNYTELVEGSEIDIEFCGRTDRVELAVHYVDETGELVHVTPVRVIDLPSDAAYDFHTWEIEVMPSHIRYFLDGAKIYEVTDREVLSEMEHPLSTRVNYWISNSVPWAGTLDRTTLPAVTLYDYVAYYRWEQ